MIKAFIMTILALLLAIAFSIIYNYLINQEFKYLIIKIKRVISSRQTKKITQIKNELINFFVEEN